MFVLRKIEKKGNVNVFLGERYKVIHRKTNFREFNRFQKMFEKDLNIFAYVVNTEDENDNMIIEPLFKESKYYIVWENGNTFERIVEIV
jgi:hypothetical protein